ncbi:MAG: hypothetical protein OSA43_11875, partial [Pirellulales bacterium]|nr:hypothetical protein [Pirellulales bacterium]
MPANSLFPLGSNRFGMVLGLQEARSGTLLCGRFGEVAFGTRPGNRKPGAGNAVANRDVIA